MAALNAEANCTLVNLAPATGLCHTMDMSWPVIQILIAVGIGVVLIAIVILWPARKRPGYPEFPTYDGGTWG